MIRELELLPETKKVLVILSGGMDSTIALRLCVEKYKAPNVYALSFLYGQKQGAEVGYAALTCRNLGVKHQLLDLSILGKISQGFSANIDHSIPMPTIKEVLGAPRPKTYVPNRNMILMSLAAAYAETENIDTIVMGLQIHDEYGYHDTTERFVKKVNDVLSENRIIKINIIAPFSRMSKYDELLALKKLDGNFNLLKNTLTCYNPITRYGSAPLSCGECPSCSERINAFMKIGEKDPVEYKIDIPWKVNV